MRNKRGSSTVLLAMIFVSFAMAVLSSVTIARDWTVRSECQAFGRVYTKAILSEYDRHLLEDYGLMGYQGSDAAVEERLRQYMDYSMKGKLNVRNLSADAALGGYEMSDPVNFRKALKASFGSTAIGTLLHGYGRAARKEGEILPERRITNPVVIDTLPSGGLTNSIDIDALSKELESGGLFSSLRNAGGSAALELAFVNTFCGSHTMTAGRKETFFPHEMEYVIRGSMSDETNYQSCRRRIFLIRNALNLVAAYKDPEKVELVAAAAELITPGPLAIVTQGILMEAWAALESEQDVQTLTGGGRVPLIKGPGEWKIGLGSVLSSEEVTGKLDEESRELLRENESEILKRPGAAEAALEITDGQTYEDYLLAMILVMNSNVRILRIMDLIQINMKYRYYDDFNFAEYYTGVRFSIHANQNTYTFQESYR